MSIQKLSDKRNLSKKQKETNMRIITGKYKGRHFDIPRTFKARPTTDFAKENIFNVLNGYIDFEGATALDLFAGTGSITLELLSRGCERVISIEKDREHHQFIKKCINSLTPALSFPTFGRHPVAIPRGEASIIRGDVFRFLKSCKQQFDFIFADPPYALKELPDIPDLIFKENGRTGERGNEGTGERRNEDSNLNSHATPSTLHPSLLKEDGIFVLEHGKDYDFSQHPHFVEHRSYGSVNFSLFR